MSALKLLVLKIIIVVCFFNHKKKFHFVFGFVIYLELGSMIFLKNKIGRQLMETNAMIKWFFQP